MTDAKKTLSVIRDLCWKAIVIAFLIDLVLGVMTLVANAAPLKCSLPIPVPYKVAQITASQITDNAGQSWILLYGRVMYTQEVAFGMKLGQYEPDQLKKATTDGLKWLDCLQKLEKKVAAKPLPKILPASSQ